MLRIILSYVAALLVAGAAQAISLGPVSEPLGLAGRTSYERAVLAALNAARADPAGLARSLRVYRGFYRARLVTVPGIRARLITQEGVRPVDEAISFLDRQATAPSLNPDRVLADAAADHTAEQSATGRTGHYGPDGTGPAERTMRRGGSPYVGEVIAYGATDPVDVIRQLVIDDGVLDRSHRQLLFAPELRYAGVSCGPHPFYHTMCVIDVSDRGDSRVVLASAR